MQFKRFAKPLSHIFGAAAGNPPAPPGPVAASASASPAEPTALALGDGSEAVREAAIRRLEDGEALRALAGLRAGPPSAVSAKLEALAQERLAQLVAAGRVDFSSLCSPGAKLDALLAVAGYGSDPALLAHALGSVDDPRRIARLVTEGGSSRVRQLAAESISDPGELRELLRRLRGKDKNVYRIIKHKCDAMRAEERRLAQTQSDIVSACESLERHRHRVYEVIYEPTFRHFNARWEALESQAPPEMRQRAARAIERCREIIADHQRNIERQAAEEADRAARRSAREREAALAEAESQQRREAALRAVAEAAARRETEEKRHADKRAAEALVLRRIGGLIGKARAELRQGNTGRAAGLRRAVEDKVSALAVVPGHLAQQMAQLDSALNELKEWKEHAAGPKRAELIEEMEALIGSPEEPQALADRIKQLQEDWKTVSKGIVIDSEADWQRFQRAAASAYQPCRDYFEARAKLREANLERRREVLDRLHAFETAQSGGAPDWPAVAAVLREAPQEWRRHAPVDRAAGRALQEEFDDAMSRLQERLEAWHAGNAQDKESLIRQVQELSGKEDRREAAEAVKRLQSRWKDVGPAGREREQGLWTQFRAQCDAIFQQRHQAQADLAASLDANKARASSLCGEIEQAAGLEGAALLEAAARIPEWRSSFEALGELPRADRRALEDRLNRALRGVQAAVLQWRSHEQRQSIAALFEAAACINAYAWAMAQSAPASDCDVLERAAEASIAAVGRWPKGGASALKDALARAGTAGSVEADAAEHEKVLRLLCIRGEILAGQSTPAEDLALRRGYQMELLVQRMGQGRDAGADEAQSLALEWVRVGPVPPQTQRALLERFLRSRAPVSD